MYLSEAIKHIECCDLVKDNGFDTLGVLGDLSGTKKLLTYVENATYIDMVRSNPLIGCVILSSDLSGCLDDQDIGVCVADKPKRVFFEIHDYLYRMSCFYEKTVRYISQTAQIHGASNIASNVRIGERSVIEANVTIYDNVEIGNDVIIRAGTVIGSEGFKFFRDGERIIGVKHVGKVIIGDNVEIQSNCCIDKAIFDNSTEIGEYTKLDNFVHIAHNARIGKRCLIAANAVIAGYTQIGDDCWIGPSSTISNSIKIGNKARITIGTVVTKDVRSNEAVYLPRQQISIPQDISRKE